MLISKRYDENHALIMNFYNNGIDPKGDTKEGYEFAEQRERMISPLAEAGDALETYLSQHPDPLIQEALSRIDTKIGIIRATEKELREML